MRTLAVIGAIILVLFVVNLVRGGAAAKLDPLDQKKPLAWLKAEDGYYLRTPLDKSKSTAPAESFLLIVEPGRVRYQSLITNAETPRGTWKDKLDGPRKGAIWTTPEGLKTLHFDGTGLLELDGQVFAKIPEPVQHEVELRTILSVREAILAGNRPYYDFPK